MPTYSGYGKTLLESSGEDQLYAALQANKKSYGSPTVSSFGEYQKYLTPNWADVNRYQERTPEEIAALQNVGTIARTLGGAGADLYSAGIPAYKQALGHYTTILSGDKGAVTQELAPELEATAESYGGAERSIDTLQGGARDYAKAELARTKAGSIAALIPQARKEAAAAAGSLGLAGVQTGLQTVTSAAGIYGNLAAQEQQNRQFGISTEMENRLRGAGIQLQHESLALQEMLGLAELDLKGDMFSYSKERDIQEDDWRSRQLNFEREKFDYSKWYQQQQLDLQSKVFSSNESEKEKERKRQLWGKIGMVAGTVVGAYFGGPAGAGVGASAGTAAGSAFGSWI